VGTISDHETRGLRRANRALDAANFFLADVRDALGPYLAVYLLTERDWDAARIGMVMSIATVAGILAQTPVGALIDGTTAKRAVKGTVMGAAAQVPVGAPSWCPSECQAALLVSRTRPFAAVATVAYFKPEGLKPRTVRSAGMGMARLAPGCCLPAWSEVGEVRAAWHSTGGRSAGGGAIGLHRSRNPFTRFSFCR
jgi:hypothetical protein